MHVTVTFPNGEIFPTDVADDIELENFLALCQAESSQLQNVDSSRLTMFFEGRLFNERKQTLREIGVKNGDMVMVQLQRSNVAANSIPNDFSGFDFSAIRLPADRRQSGSIPHNLLNSSNDNPENLARAILADPAILAALRQRNPQLAEMLEKRDIAGFTKAMQENRRRQMEELERRRRILSNPLDPEAQRMLEDEIRLRHVDENMEIAMEHTPESFGTVHMLYIKCKVNGHEIKAFVDSGAQSTIMSQSCALTCNIMRLIDNRYQGIAKGVGTSKIIGRIHLAQLQIGNDYLPTSFMVLEDQSVDMLLGLDMLKRHQCVIDLKNNKLIIGTTGGETEFLPENELPASARQHNPSVDEETGLSQAIANSLNDPKLPKASGSGIPSPGNTVNENLVTQLTAMGFSRETVLNALRKCGNNADAATALLIASSLPAPKSTKK